MRRKQRFIIIHVFFVRESSLCACFFTFLTRRKPIPSTFLYEIIKRKFLPKFLNIFPFVAVFLCPHNNFLTVLKTTRELFYPLCYEGWGRRSSVDIFNIFYYYYYSKICRQFYRYKCIGTSLSNPEQPIVNNCSTTNVGWE